MVERRSHRGSSYGDLGLGVVCGEDGHMDDNDGS